MAWEDTLLPASFRGIVFEVVSTNDEISRGVIVNEYPYVDGGSTEDMGRNARTMSMVAVFYGIDYEIQLQQFIEAIDTPGSGELVHPVFGSIKAQFQRASLPHEASQPNQTRVTLEFTEDALRRPLFDRVVPLAQVEAVNTAADTVQAAAASQFEREFAALKDKASSLRDKLQADMSGVVEKMRGYADQVLDARTWVASGIFYLNNPVAFVDDLTSGLVSRVKGVFSPINLKVSYGGADPVTGILSSYSRGGLETSWRAPLAHIQQPLLEASVSAAGQPTPQFLLTHVDVQVAIAVASCSAELFSRDLVDTVLTPADVETVANDVRAVIKLAIEEVRATYPDIVQSRPITEPLKALALSVTVAAERLLSSKPPLLSRTVHAPANLHFLAHLWYGDFNRADELLRLNAHVTNPNFVPVGAVLQAYAE